MRIMSLWIKAVEVNLKGNRARSWILIAVISIVICMIAGFTSIWNRKETMQQMLVPVPAIQSEPTTPSSRTTQPITHETSPPGHSSKDKTPEKPPVPHETSQPAQPGNDKTAPLKPPITPKKPAPTPAVRQTHHETKTPKKSVDTEPTTPVKPPPEVHLVPIPPLKPIQTQPYQPVPPPTENVPPATRATPALPEMAAPAAVVHPVMASPSPSQASTSTSAGGGYFRSSGGVTY